MESQISTDSGIEIEGVSEDFFSDTYEECEDKDEIPRALLIDVILRKIFGLCNVSTLKKCRRVCTKWNEVISGILKLKSRTILNFNTKSTFRGKPSDLLQLWNEVFSDDDFISSCRLKGIIDLGKASTTRFLREQGTKFLELTLDDVRVTGNNNENEFDLNVLVFSNVLRLNILSQGEQRGICCRSLAKVSYAYLKNCLLTPQFPEQEPMEIIDGRLLELKLENIIISEIYPENFWNCLIGISLQKLHIFYTQFIHSPIVFTNRFLCLQNLHLQCCRVRLDNFVPLFPLINNLKEMILDRIIVMGREGDIVDNYDVSLFIGKKLESLRLHSGRYTRLCVSLDQIRSLEGLHLNDVDIKVYRNDPEDISRQGQNKLKDLSLDAIKIVDTNGEEQEIFDTCRYFVGCQLKRLKLSASQPRLTVATDQLTSVEYLTMDHCTIFLNADGGDKISAKEIKLLDDITFIRDKQELSEVRTNEFLNFPQIKILKLQCFLPSKIVLDLNEKIDVEILYLWNTKIINWENANCRANHLNFRNGNFDYKMNNFHIRDLRIMESSMDLSALPDTVENFVICERTVFKEGKNSISSLNLKYLHVMISSPASIPDFCNCHNLNKIILENSGSDYVKLDLCSLPKSIQHLKSKHFKFVGDTFQNLETMILQISSLDAVNDILLPFRCKNLVLHSGYGWFFEGLQVVDKISEWIYKKRFQTITIGRIMWEKGDFENFPPEVILDGESGYYIFDSVVGKAIEAKDFFEVLEI